MFVPTFVFAMMPNDPEARQWAYEHVGLYKAWDYAIGSSDVVVAVIDNGVDFLHPDLMDNAWKNIDEIPNNDIDDDKNGFIDDVWGWNFVDNNNDPRPNVEALSETDKEEYTFSHGTLVAGLIGAVGNNGIDGTGVSWRAKIMSIKILDNSGEGDIVPLAPAIRYAVDNGADVINISAVGYENGDKDDIKQAVKYAYEKGAAIIAAAGNNNTYLNASPLYPICADLGTGGQMVLGVSAVTPDHHVTRFSNTGSDCIDIAAPGIDVSSTVRFSPTNGLIQRYKGGWSGTSFAAPLVSGAAALLKGL
ncbi:S8 family serine peptidase, partial [Candidatus Peregrinibacteria bacterium]|nr:S8 family serine peptidase [Candidatus Peregrinibacteria bacterium]